MLQSTLSVAQARQFLMRQLPTTSELQTAPDKSAVILTRPHPAVAVITLHNTRRRNAMTPQMMLHLDDIITRLASDASSDGALSALIIMGANQTFCAGLGTLT